MSRSFRSPRTRTRVIPNKKKEILDEVELIEAYQEYLETNDEEDFEDAERDEEELS